MTLVDITAFGADSSGVQDSTPAVVAALEHVRTLSGPVRLVFPRGTYQLYPEHAVEREFYISNTVGADQAHRLKRFAFLVEDLADLTIDGDGSTFRLHGLMGLFAVVRSERVTLRDFAFDTVAPKVVDVTVAETGPAYRVLSIPPGNPYVVDGALSFLGETSPVSGTPYWRYRSDEMWYCQIHDPVAQRTWRGRNPLFTDVAGLTDLGSHRVRVDYSSGEFTDEGLVYQLREPTRDTAAGFIWESAQVTVTNLQAGYLHGFGIVGQLSTDITITGNSFHADRAKGRSTAAFADILQMSGVGGTVTITGNLFDGAHDDPINIHGTYLEVVGVAGAALDLQYMHDETGGFPQFHVGDVVELVDKLTMVGVAQATVTAVDGPTGLDSSKPLTTMTITLDTAVPEVVTPGAYVVENVTYTPSVRIAGNTFRNVPTRGALVTTRRRVVIEDNVFDGMTMASIYVSADAHQWYESGPVRDLVIRRNRFLRPATPVIWFDPTNQVEGEPVHRGVRIEDNDFELTGDGEVLRAKSVGGLVFTGNRVTGGEPAYTFSGCTEVSVE
ncbi:right-handed parallel beta-helix repeat-containing protein [Kribbella sp. NPDC051770]|uniref:right-handed parallel beta-helix repeat-containing protein n=1 Tax=Kribbella sp. NPDC051770 TaxID=3155413 RepID=UPI00342B3BA2